VAAHLGVDEVYLWPDAFSADQVANEAGIESLAATIKNAIVMYRRQQRRHTAGQVCGRGGEQRCRDGSEHPGGQHRRSTCSPRRRTGRARRRSFAFGEVGADLRGETGAGPRGRPRTPPRSGMS